MLHVHRAERADRLADGLADTLLISARGSVHARRGRGADARDRAVADPAALDTTRHDRQRPGRRRVRERRVPVPGPADSRRPGGGDRDRSRAGSVAGRTVGVAAARCRRRVPRRAVAGGAGAAPRGRAGRPRGSDAPVRGGSPPRGPFRPLRRAPPRHDRDLGGPPGGDPDDWQAELWRRLRARIGAPSPAERLAPACRRIREDPELLELPARLSLFGLTRIPRSYLDVLSAIAEQRDVHLFVLHPSPALWRRVSQELDNGPRITGRHDDRTAQLPTNRLLASWGRDARELQLVLAGGVRRSSMSTRCCQRGADTLLARIQADVRDDRARPARRCRASPTPGRFYTPTTAASRSTPATAAPARSRCCATRSCTCSRTTRRSSRAT